MQKLGKQRDEITYRSKDLEIVDRFKEILFATAVSLLLLTFVRSKPFQVRPLKLARNKA